MVALNNRNDIPPFRIDSETACEHLILTCMYILTFKVDITPR